LPLIVWKCARPVVPPAPGLKSVVLVVSKPSAIRVFEIASVVAEYPPGPAGTVQSIVVSGFRSGYHQRRLPAAVPMVTLVQVRFDPSTLLMTELLLHSLKLFQT
jgi:hypothetical protein